MSEISAVLCRVILEDRTKGIIFDLKGKSYNTIELPWRDNKPRVSCIPDGIYDFVREYSPNKDRIVIEIKGIEGRSEIQIHAGTKTDHVKGCIGIGTSAQEKAFMLAIPVKGKIQIKTIEI